MNVSNETAKTDEYMTCPNCSHMQMQLDPTAIFKLDGLAWFAVTGNTLLIWRGMTYFALKILDYLLFPVNADNPAGYFFSLVGFVLSFYFSYSLTTALSRIQERRNGISIWHLRCGNCHVKYRIVRPYGVSVPWEFPDEESQETDVTDEA